MSKVELLQGVKPKSVIKYMVLPGIIPRIREFFSEGFGWLALLMAGIYRSVKLIPEDHPYLNEENKGRFGIRHVIAEAANNLVIKRENIDQIIVFFALLMGFVILCVQFAMLVFGFIISPAFAGFGAFVGIFQTPGCVGSGAACPDIAFMLLDKVFAIPDLYNSRFAPAGPGAIPAFNRALQLLFNYYNLAMLLVGAIIFLYYVIVMVAETAQSGTPFGRRFNHVYAPLRLVAAIGFLVPLNYGLNSAQYITLFSAKYGSSMATNAWIAFNTALPGAATPIGTSSESLLARPRAPDIKNLLVFMSLVRTCEALYERQFPAGNGNVQIDAYFVKNAPGPVNQPIPIGAGGFQQGLTFYNNQDVVIRFGQLLPGQDTLRGNVDPLCGEVVIKVNDTTQIGAMEIQDGYYRIVTFLWSTPELGLLGNRAAAMEKVGLPNRPQQVTGFGHPGDDDPTNLPSIEWKRSYLTQTQGFFDTWVQGAYDNMLGGTTFTIPPQIIAHGWGGAGIWYNHIAEWNGSLFSAAINVPTPSLLPSVMEKVQEEKRTNNNATTTNNQFEPTLASGDEIQFQGDHEEVFARVFNNVYKWWTVDGNIDEGDMSTSGNVFYDTMNALLGIGGLFEMRQNDDIHPLAQLTAIGRSMVESSIRNLMSALVFSVGGGMASVLNEHLGASLNAASGIFVSLATIGLTIGFILYYVLPFLPFIYFFFAVGGWVKGIFEAMVGVPLWALAHLRVDGNGFPGDSASNGYFLIFEIFVRPILCVFGLVGGLAIFSAMARTLNGVFDLLIANVAGFECVADTGAAAGNETFGNCTAGNTIYLDMKRNIVDEFFFSIIYTIIVYLLATSSFKLIDQIPNSILRWAGAGVQSFGDNRDDPASGLVQYAAFGGANMAGQVTQAMQSGAQTVGMAGGTAVAGAGRGISSILGRNGSFLSGRGGS